jgi:hypothetical protein
MNFAIEATLCEPPREVRTVTRREKATAVPSGDRSRTRQNAVCLHNCRGNDGAFSDGACDNARQVSQFQQMRGEIRGWTTASPLRFATIRDHRADNGIKIGGDGRDTNQMNDVFNFTYFFDNGWAIGTQPTLSVDWKARGGERGAFGLGPQVGKMCKCGGLPTLLQLQVQYYPIRPDVGSPKWNIQLQASPTIPALIKKTLF